MAIGSFSPPKGWEDWATLLLGLLLWVSPIVLRLDDAVALQFLVVGFLVILCELFAFYFLRTWEEWINIVLGVWLIVSAWLLITPEARAVAIRFATHCVVSLRDLGRAASPGRVVIDLPSIIR